MRAANLRLGVNAAAIVPEHNRLKQRAAQTTLPV